MCGVIDISRSDTHLPTEYPATPINLTRGAPASCAAWETTQPTAGVALLLYGLQRLHTGENQTKRRGGVDQPSPGIG